MRVFSGSDYQAAIQNPKIAFLDRTLQTGSVELDALGLPKARAGNFAITFKVVAGGRELAIRCFTKQKADLQSRYAKISEHLKGHPVNYFVDFEYQEAGIRVNSAVSPIVRMDWVNGEPLLTYIKKNRFKLNSLEELRVELRRIARAIDSSAVSHGDVSAQNILVSSLGAVSLVDYDGMFVPAIGGLAPELGHPDWQHPGRNATEYGPHIDRFSFLLADLGIRSIISNPRLLETYKPDQNLLFTAKDLKEPTASPLFNELARDPSLRSDVEKFQGVCLGRFADVPAVDELFPYRKSSRSVARRVSTLAGSSSKWFRSVAHATVDKSRRIIGSGRSIIISGGAAIPRVQRPISAFQQLGGIPRNKPATQLSQHVNGDLKTLALLTFLIVLVIVPIVVAPMVLTHRSSSPKLSNKSESANPANAEQRRTPQEAPPVTVPTPVTTTTEQRSKEQASTNPTDSPQPRSKSQSIQSIPGTAISTPDVGAADVSKRLQSGEEYPRRTEPRFTPPEPRRAIEPNPYPPSRNTPDICFDYRGQRVQCFDTGRPSAQTRQEPQRECFYDARGDRRCERRVPEVDDGGRRPSKADRACFYNRYGDYVCRGG